MIDGKIYPISTLIEMIAFRQISLFPIYNLLQKSVCSVRPMLYCGVPVDRPGGTRNGDAQHVGKGTTMTLSYSDFLASRKTETVASARNGVCDLTAPIYAGLTREADFDTRNINKIYGEFVQTVLNNEHGQRGDLAKPEAAKRHITAMQAMLDWLAEADTNHVCVRGKMFRLTLVPTTPPEPVPNPVAGKGGNPAGAK